MTKNRDIIAIFTNSLHFQEVKKFLVISGYKVIRKTDFRFPRKEILKECIFIVEIDKEKKAEIVSSFLEKNQNNTHMICIFKKNIKISMNYQNLKTLSQPFTFNELLKNLVMLEKNLYDNANSFKFIGLDYFPNYSKFVKKRDGETIKLTDLENKLVLFILKNNQGCSKSDILKNVWEHKTDLHTHTMESLIYRLRRKIEKDPNNPEILVQIKNKYFLKNI